MKTQANEQRLAELSALFDGEAAEHAVDPLIKAAVREPALRETWQLYALIGDQLRAEGGGAPDMTASVMARIGAEPVVLAPRRLPARQQHPFMALAASLAGVAVVGWLALSDGAQTPPSAAQMAAVPPAPTFVQPVVVAQAVAQAAVPGQGQAGDMSEYLLAHHTQAASFRLGDSTEHVRTVSMTARPTRP